MRVRRMIAVFLLVAALLSVSCFSEAVLKDGEYTADGFSWSGGSGRLKGITCDKISVRDGVPYASITLASSKYTYIKVDGEQYDCVRDESGSTAEIPVKLNRTMTVLACTMAMGSPHEIAYKLRIELEAAKNDSDEGITLADTQFELVDEGEHIRIYRSGNADLIETDDNYYYISDDPESIPAGMEDEANVIVRPVSSVYITTNAAEYLAGSAAEGIMMVAEADPENAYMAEKIANGSIIVVGRPAELDYRTLLVKNCELAVLDESDVSEEILEYLDMIGIPVYIDREDACREEAFSIMFKTEAE